METTVNYLTFDEIGITVAVVLVALAAVVLVWNAVKAVHDWRQMAGKPVEDKLDDHESRIAKLETCCDEVQGKLASDWQHQQSSIETQRLMLKSIKQLLKHSIDGNDIKGLKSMEDEIDAYLLEHTK